MVTKQKALALWVGDEIHYNIDGGCRILRGPRGGMREVIERWRVSGRCKTWKRDLERFHIPVARGMYIHHYIDERNGICWHTAQDCRPLRPEQARVAHVTHVREVLREVANAQVALAREAKRAFAVGAARIPRDDD